LYPERRFGARVRPDPACALHITDHEVQGRSERRAHLTIVIASGVSDERVRRLWWNTLHGIRGSIPWFLSERPRPIRGGDGAKGTKGDEDEAQPEALDGILLVSWSTALLYAVFQRGWKGLVHADANQLVMSLIAPAFTRTRRPMKTPTSHTSGAALQSHGYG
jgi:hypothetical protein